MVRFNYFQKIISGCFQSGTVITFILYLLVDRILLGQQSFCIVKLFFGHSLYFLLKIRELLSMGAIYLPWQCFKMHGDGFDCDHIWSVLLADNEQKPEMLEVLNAWGSPKRHPTQNVSHHPWEIMLQVLRAGWLFLESSTHQQTSPVASVLILTSPTWCQKHGKFLLGPHCWFLTTVFLAP